MHVYCHDYRNMNSFRAVERVCLHVYSHAHKHMNSIITHMHRTLISIYTGKQTHVNYTCA